MLASGRNAGHIAAFLFDAARRAGALCSKVTYTMREKECTPCRLDRPNHSPSKERRECGTSRQEPRPHRSQLPCLWTTTPPSWLAVWKLRTTSDTGLSRTSVILEEGLALESLELDICFVDFGQLWPGVVRYRSVTCLDLGGVEVSQTFLMAFLSLHAPTLRPLKLSCIRLEWIETRDEICAG